MKATRGRQLATSSARLYRRLLHLLPAPFRGRFAGEMAQLFTDLCREEVQRAGLWGLARVWLYALPDLAANAAAEHLRQFKTAHHPHRRYAPMKSLIQPTRLSVLLGLCLLAYSALFVLYNVLTYELGLALPIAPYAITATGVRGELLRQLRDLAIIAGPVLAVLFFVLPYLRLEWGGEQRWLTLVVRPLDRVMVISILVCLTVLGLLFTYVFFENLPCLLGQLPTC